MKEVRLRAPIPGGRGQALEPISSWHKNSNAFGRKLTTAKNNWNQKTGCAHLWERKQAPELLTDVNASLFGGVLPGVPVFPMP